MTAIDFKRIFESAPSLFVVLLPDARFTIAAASDAYLRLTGLTRESVLGRALFDVFPDGPHETHAGAMANLRTSLQRVQQTRQPDTMGKQRFDLPRPDAPAGTIEYQERHWMSTNTPVPGGDGELLYIVHEVQDHTELVLAGRREQQQRANLAHANRRFQAVYDESLFSGRAQEILDSINEGFYALDRDWRFICVNREARRIVNGSRDDLIGKVVWAVYPGLLGSGFENIYRRAMVEREPSSLTDFYPDHKRWYEVHAYPASDGVSIYFRDVSAQKEAEAAQQRFALDSDRQRRIYEAALSNTPDLVYVFDRAHRFIYANEALLGMWGKSREEVLGKNCLELGYEPWHAEMHDREIEQVVATRVPVRGEVPFTGTNGRRIYDYIFVPVVGNDDEVVGVAGTMRDVTDRQQAEQSIREQSRRLEQADQAKDEFLATLSHELRNPLAPLRNSLSLLRLGQSSGVASKPLHEMMERQVNHLVRLVDDLLDMSRVSRGKLVLRKEQVEVAAIVRNAVETIQPLVQSAGHVLGVSLADGPLWVEGDPVRLGQILANLLDNAAKYTEDGGRILVAVRRQDDTVSISVRDDGAGMDPQALPHMFEMFNRGDTSAARGQNGLGIGLALSRRLAEMHGGSLDAHSDGPGKGSEFTVTLPLSRQQVSPAPAAPVAAPVNNARPILVVDDNRDAADSLGTLLEFLGAEVRIAYDGPAALAAFATFQPTVVLLDIGMPGMDGYEVARTLRARYPGRPLTLIALTGWGQEGDRERARNAGFDHHLTKPVEIDTLLALLELSEYKTDDLAASA